MLSPFVASLRASADRALADAVRAWIGGPHAAVRAERSASIETRVPTRIVVGEGEARLGILVHLGGAEGWRAGPIAVTIEREVEGRSPTATPEGRSWLRSMAAWFGDRDPEALAEAGRSFAAVHRTWAISRSLDDRFYRHVEQSTHGPSALLRPSFRCSQDCEFCWQGRDWPDPPESLVMTWLDELAATGARRITICGGEPTLFRSLPALVERAARAHGMTVHMDTNAIRFRDRAFGAALRERGLSSLLVSLHAASADVSDVMTRARGTWQRTVEGIHGALDAGLAVGVNCVVERANVSGLEAHARFVRDELVLRHPENPVRVVNYSQPGKYYDEGLFRERMVPLDEARPHVTAAARVLHAAGVMLEITGSCGFPGCIVSEIPDVVPWRPESLHDVAHASGRSRAPAPCARCAARGHCVGLRREYVEVFGERGLQPYASLPTASRARSVAETIGADAAAAPVPAARASDARVRLPIFESGDGSS